jgi:hypothetical protein
MVPSKHREALADILAEQELELNGSDTDSGSAGTPPAIVPNGPPGAQRILQGIQRRRLESVGLERLRPIRTAPATITPEPVVPEPVAPAAEEQPEPTP